LVHTTNNGDGLFYVSIKRNIFKIIVDYYILIVYYISNK